MSELRSLESRLLASWAPQFWVPQRLVVAISGGADSVALLRLVHAIASAGEASLQAAHLNHRLRGAESDDDAQFVVELCRQLDVPLHLKQVDVSVLAEQGGEGLEVAARHARYEFFKQIAQRNGPILLLTAHTADDQAETILHRIVRGTGLAGLRGIPRRRRLVDRSYVERPLLDLRRNELLEYLLQLHQSYREDSSNRDARFTRNRLRHELLVELGQHYNPNVVEALLRLGAMAGEVQEIIDRQVQPLYQAAVRHADHVTTIGRIALCDEPHYLVREVLIATWRERDWPLQAMGYGQWDLLAGLLLAEPDELAAHQHILPGHIVAQRRGDELRLWAGVSA